MIKYFYNKYKYSFFQPRKEWLLRRLAQNHEWNKFFEHLLFGVWLWFDKIITPIFSKDISKLKEYNYDIRQILMENSFKDAQVESDDRFITYVTIVNPPPLTWWQKFLEKYPPVES